MKIMIKSYEKSYGEKAMSKMGSKEDNDDQALKTLGPETEFWWIFGQK